MTPVTFVPLRNDLVAQLIARYQDDYDRYIDHAVESFLERTSDDYNAQFDPKSGKDYIWGQLIMPEGTELRTKYKNQYETATLKNQRFEYDGEVYASPSLLCNAMRGHTSNNAWIHLEIKRPQDIDYKLADKFRR